MAALKINDDFSNDDNLILLSRLALSIKSHNRDQKLKIVIFPPLYNAKLSVTQQIYFYFNIHSLKAFIGAPYIAM